MKVTLPDNTSKELPDGATGADLAREIGPGLAKAALAVRVDGQRRWISRRRCPTASRWRSLPIAARTPST